MSSARSIGQIKSALLRPSLTSKFSIRINTRLLVLNDFFGTKTATDEFHMSCSEASLPGSSLNTQEITGDRHGVTERNAYRRMYDDRLDLTFYVEGENYSQIRFFEKWMNFIVGDDTRDARISSRYDYKVKYPEEYKTEMQVIKFEKDDGLSLTYSFIDTYPIAINSMPLSYGSTDLLKCTVSMTYLRYIVEDTKSKGSSRVSSKPKEYDLFGNTAGPGTPFVERDSATGAPLVPGVSDGPLLTARQALGLDPI